MNAKLKIIVRTGYAAKGSVYAIVGILTFLGAFNMGGGQTSKFEVLKFLERQLFGNFLLILMALGLVSYALWRFIQSFSDPEHVGSDTKGMLKRAGFFISGMLYTGFAITAVMRVMIAGKSNNSSGSPENSHFLSTTLGLILLGLIGFIIIISAFLQFKKAYKEEFLKEFDISSIGDEKKRKTLEATAKFGLSARGLIFLIIGYFAVYAAWRSKPSEVKTTKDVFSFIEDSSFGVWMLGLVAAGLVAYSIYMFLLAKYRKFRG